MSTLPIKSDNRKPAMWPSDNLPGVFFKKQANIKMFNLPKTKSQSFPGSTSWQKCQIWLSKEIIHIKKVRQKSIPDNLDHQPLIFDALFFIFHSL